MMVPTHARPMLTLIAAKRVGTAAGTTTLVNTCQRLAPKDRRSTTLPGSVSRKAVYSMTMVTTTAMATAMASTARTFVPSQMINRGPKLILGTLLRTTRYGSNTRAQKGDHHKKEATTSPKAVARPKPAKVRQTVAPRCRSEEHTSEL